MIDDRDEYWRNPPEGFGSMHDLQGDDPRNPRLVGLRSVSYAGAVGLARRAPPKPAVRFGFARGLK